MFARLAGKREYALFGIALTTSSKCAYFVARLILESSFILESLQNEIASAKTKKNCSSVLPIKKLHIKST